MAMSSVSIVSLARDLKRCVIVEGVENEADAVRMAELGCEYAQGFLFSRAADGDRRARVYRAPLSRAREPCPVSGAAGLGGQP